MARRLYLYPQTQNKEALAQLAGVSVDAWRDLEVMRPAEAGCTDRRTRPQPLGNEIEAPCKLPRYGAQGEKGGFRGTAYRRKSASHVRALRSFTMARGKNTIHLIGALTQDPEMKYTAGGLAILEMSLGGNDDILGRNGEKKSLAWYHRVTAFGKQAEYLADQVEAGSVVSVEGRLNYRSWEDQDGQKRSALGVNAVRVDVLSYGPRTETPTTLDARGQERLNGALNAVCLIGNLIRDAELRYTPSGDAVNRFVLAVNEVFTSRDGQQQENLHFAEVNVWRELAENTAELAKGDPVMVMGRLVTDNWTDKDGKRNYKDKVEGTRVEYLARKPQNDAKGKPAAANRKRTEAASAPPPLPEEEFPPEAELPF